MAILALLRRLHIVSGETEHRAPPRARAAEGGGPVDRSELLRDLEVAVPAPERIVAWDDARGAQRLSRT